MNLLNQKIIESIIIIDICWHLHTQLFVVFVVHFILHSVQCTHFFKSVKLIEPNLDNSHTPFRNFLHTITLTCSFFFSHLLLANKISFFITFDILFAYGFWQIVYVLTYFQNKKKSVFCVWEGWKKKMMEQGKYRQ